MHDCQLMKLLIVKPNSFMEENGKSMQTDVRVLGVKQLGVLLIHCRSSQRITSGLPNSSSVTIYIPGVERVTVPGKLSCP